MQPFCTDELSEDCEGRFPFLDFQQNCETPSATYSWKRKVPKSALDILCVDLQINREAYAHFYSQNDYGMEREASPIYFGENTFQLSRPEGLSVWKRFTAPRHIKQMRKVALSGWTKLRGASADTAFKGFSALPKLESLTFCLKEEEALKNKLMCPDFLTPNRPITWHPSLGFSPQANLQLLQLRGVDGLRSLRRLREVKLVKGLGVSCEKMNNIMQPRSPKKAPHEDHAPFRFLDLPPELRNMIYRMLLLFPGHRTQTRRVPWSALEILRINRQVHDEARKLFYQNDLVFSDPTDMQDFMYSLSDARARSYKSCGCRIAVHHTFKMVQAGTV
ncbi:hypothetical protein MBLNU13_g05116t2 [Cladosporium sp. NU13]